jgi:hypothetical protein
MGIKKLRKRAEKLSLRIQILENKQRITDLQREGSKSPMGFHMTIVGEPLPRSDEEPLVVCTESKENL